MTKTDKQALIDGLKKLSEDVAELAALLESSDAPAAPAKAYSYEEARAILAEKARVGFRAEVRALLTAHSIRQLSDVKDPGELAAIVAEAEGIGNG